MPRVARKGTAQLIGNAKTFRVHTIHSHNCVTVFHRNVYNSMTAVERVTFLTVQAGQISATASSSC